MKKKSLNKKLALKKEVIANIRGGGKPVDLLFHGPAHTEICTVDCKPPK